ncbi:hypothetical protein F2Q69_00036114 [Brassica cretica]|uniref:Uncharacterized protein n=1 Tax=Brassica cretica TaxID=69181 RepID=A0A8S9SNF3_BRACR|nr:hypothetical protein F2Q69_00036114 [Brassica cretica]
MDGVDLIRVLLELISALRLRRPDCNHSGSYIDLYGYYISTFHLGRDSHFQRLEQINGLQTLYRPRDCVCPMVFTRGSSLDGRKYINKSLMILGNVINKLSESSKLRYMPSSTRSNKVTQLLFSPDLVSLERSIRKKAHSSSTDINTRVSLDSAQPPSTHTPVPSTDTRSPLSTDNAHLPSTDIFHPTSIDIPSRTSIDTEQRDMVVPLILVRDNNGDLHDQEGHLHNAAGMNGQRSLIGGLIFSVGPSFFKLSSSVSKELLYSSAGSSLGLSCPQSKASIIFSLNLCWSILALFLVRFLLVWFSCNVLIISALTSKVEAIQGELVEIKSYIARRPEAALSIDRRNNISTDIHHRTSVDNATNRGRLVPKMTSDMSNTHYRGEEISADTYTTLTRHQFNLESLGERLQRIENTTATIKDKWRREDEAIRDFTGTWFNKRKEEMDTCFPTSPSSQNY